MPEKEEMIAIYVTYHLTGGTSVRCYNNGFAPDNLTDVEIDDMVHGVLNTLEETVFETKFLKEYSQDTKRSWLIRTDDISGIEVEHVREVRQ